MCYPRLKKEQELLREADLEVLREALSSEIHFLQSVSTSFSIQHVYRIMFVECVVNLCS